MKNSRLIGVIFLAGICLSFMGCSETQNDERLQPSDSAAITFDASRYEDFADYVSQTRNNLQNYKIYLNPKNSIKELEAATPFELRPDASCPANQPAKGILLIHGLSDMPFAMRDLGEAFAERCFLTRSILLPGHGTRAADLLNISYTDWLNAARFALKTLQDEVDDVYVGGFSLGGLLATRLAIDDPSIRGIFAFSPALSLQKSGRLRQTVWLRYIIDWADRDPPDDFARYEAIPMNGLAETWLFMDDFQETLSTKPLTVPLFLAQSDDDVIIDAGMNKQLFQQYALSDLSKAIIYAQKPPQQIDDNDARIKYINSYLPAQRIAGFSHQAVHISPDNSHYGASGTYRNCGYHHSGENTDKAENCLTSEDVWFTEIFNHNNPYLPEDAITARLTFNPLFKQLLEEIDGFLTHLDDTS